MLKKIKMELTKQEKGDIGKTLGKLVEISKEFQTQINKNNAIVARECLDEMILGVAPIYANYRDSSELPPIIEAITMSIDNFNEKFPQNRYTSQIFEKYLDLIKKEDEYVRRT